MNPFRKYRSDADPAPFIGALRKMSFHADQMHGFTGGVQRLRQITPDGEVILTRVNDMDIVDIFPTIVSSFIIEFVSEQDGRNVRSGINIIYVYDSDWVSVPVTITEIVSGEVGSEKYKYKITVPKEYGDDGSGGTSGSKKITINSKFFITFGIVTEDHIGHVICKKNFINYADWYINGGIKAGSYIVKVPYFLSGVMQTNYNRIELTDVPPFEQPLPFPLQYGPDYLSYAQGHLSGYNCFYDPWSGNMSRVSDTINASISCECSDSVTPVISGTIQYSTDGVYLNGAFGYFYDPSEYYGNHMSYSCGNYWYYTKYGVLIPNYPELGPSISYNFSSDIIDELTDVTYEIAGYTLNKIERLKYPSYAQDGSKNDVKSGSISFSYSSNLLQTYQDWGLNPDHTDIVPINPVTLRMLNARFRVLLSASYGTMKYIKNV